ncbi:MAG: Rieske (2Fe-2S) protein, partial [Nitrososphaerota archaeon]
IRKIIKNNLTKPLMGKVIVAKTSDVAPGMLHKASVDGREILVANIGGKYYAMDDTCTHAGASLSEGTLDGNIVTCGWHGAQFDCKSGNLEKFPAKINNLKSYNVSVESDNIFVEV